MRQAWVPAVAALPPLLAALAANRLAGDRIATRAGFARREGPDRTVSWVGGRWSRLALSCVAAAVGAGAGTVVAGPPGSVAGACAALAAPVVRRRRARARRLALLESELAEAVSAISAALRAGLSLSQAIRLAADEGAGPVGPSLHELVDRTDLGMPIRESLERWVASLPGPDVRLVAGVLELAHRTGGDAPAVLDRVARTLRERRVAAQEIRSLTSQARLSGAILGFLPIGFFLFLSATSREGLKVVYETRAGVIAITLGLGMQAGAFLWIRRLLRVEA